ncbi:ribonuclease III [Candidatus Poribacteria bacterium]|nr:ribonuclease III [Candidatus Poribacteria bacterium]
MICKIWDAFKHSILNIFHLDSWDKKRYYVKEESKEIPSEDENIPSSIVIKQKDLDKITKEQLKRMRMLEERIGYKFSYPKNLYLSLTHKSCVTNNGNYLKCNERMEFLGDSVLALVVNSFLYEEFPEYDEGQLSKLKAVAVSRSTLALCARELGLGSFIRFGSSELSSGGGDKSSNLANALEALIAAIYLDGGLKKAEEFILKILMDRIYELDNDELKCDYKTALQESWQSNSPLPPVYTVVAETGPDHNKRFEVEVRLAGEPYGRGIGKNKKEAEQRAAEKALEVIFDRRREEVAKVSE